MKKIILKLSLICFLLITSTNITCKGEMQEQSLRAGTDVENDSLITTTVIQQEAPPEQEVKPSIVINNEYPVYQPQYPSIYYPYYNQYTYPGYAGPYYSNTLYRNPGNFSFNYTGFGFSYGNFNSPAINHKPPKPPHPQKPPHNNQPPHNNGNHNNPPMQNAKPHNNQPIR